MIGQQDLTRKKSFKNFNTIESLPPELLKIFLKIKEQLEDDNHPLSLIVTEFHKQFKHYIQG